MYDSVYPTRTARFGVALVPGGVLKLKNAAYAQDFTCVLCVLCLMCAVRAVQRAGQDRAVYCLSPMQFASPQMGPEKISFHHFCMVQVC